MPSFGKYLKDSPLSMRERFNQREADIELPNSGKADPSIKQRTPNVLEGLRKAGEGLAAVRKLTEKK